MFSREVMRASVAEFLPLYARRPIAVNEGGMGLNHSWATWYLLRQLNPAVVVESGVYRGHSTWLIEQTVPSATVYSFDVNLRNRTYISDKVHYHERDLTQFDWSTIDTANAVCFLDDHQNAYQRLIQLSWLGFRYAIVEDNWPVGEGDCYSLRHLRAGAGAESTQMSKAYLGGMWAQRARRRQEAQLWALGHAQELLVPPNTYDRANLDRRLKVCVEMPPLQVPAKTMWNTEWSGAYACAEPLLPDTDFTGQDLSYSYLTFIELNGQPGAR